MAGISWDDSMSVGVKDIDDQHKKLIAILEDMHEAMRTRESGKIIKQVIERLKDYAREHFTFEEKCMERAGYPDLQAHRIEHDKFIEKILDFDLELKEGDPMVNLNVWKFLRNWLTGHINGSDRKYASHLKAKGMR